MTTSNPLEVLQNAKINLYVGDGGLSAGRALQGVNEVCLKSDNPDARAELFIKELTGIERTYEQANMARITVMGLVELLVTDPHRELEDALITAEMRATKHLKSRDAVWMYTKTQSSTVVPSEMKTVTEHSETKVAVKMNGEMKKGGKQVLAAELFTKFVLSEGSKMDRQGFIAVLIKELGMTKAGATTYCYNCMKAQGMPSHWEAGKKGKKGKKKKK